MLVPSSALCSDRPPELPPAMRFLGAAAMAAGAPPSKTLGPQGVAGMHQASTEAHIITKIDRSLGFALHRHCTHMELAMHHRMRMMAQALYDAWFPSILGL